ncbi:MAG: F0F1 ATP synthase subunit epsilon [Planctomycetota bacterium]
MSDASFRCLLITPTERMLDVRVTYADVPMHDGQRGVMPRTAPIVGKLGPGELRLELAEGGEQSYYIEGGFMQHVDGTLTVLSTTAEEAASIDAGEARAALAEANARTSTDTDEMDRITNDRRKATVRVALAGKA